MTILFIESSVFSKQIYKYLHEEEYLVLQGYLASYPSAGKVVSGSGGIRKLRWGRSGTGKRGGLRIIYYYKAVAGRIWLLTVYAKSEAEDISINDLRILKKELDTG